MNFRSSNRYDSNSLPLFWQLRRQSRSPFAACAGAKVFFVGAGPGAHDLITLRGAEVLRKADAILYDDLSGQEVLSAHASPTAELIYVGKRGGKLSLKQSEIDDILLKYAKDPDTRHVVRLKGGCPSVFSRLHTEVNVLKRNNVSYDIIPGVSSVLSAPLFAGFSLTHPEVSRAFVVTSGHDVDALSWPALAALDTVVFLMGASNMPRIVNLFLEHGKTLHHPVCVVKDAGLGTQVVIRGVLGDIADKCAHAGSLSPCIIIFGEVAGLY